MRNEIAFYEGKQSSSVLQVVVSFRMGEAKEEREEGGGVRTWKRGRDTPSHSLPARAGP